MNTSRTLRFLSLVVLAAVAVSPYIAHAQGIVPNCSGPECQACDLLQLVQNIINTLIQIASFVAVIMLTWTGGKMVYEGKDNPLKHSMLRKQLRRIVIGFLLMLSAWLIVDTAMKTVLNNQALGAWNKIQCVPQPKSASGVQSSVGGVGVPTQTCASCLQLSDLGLRCSSASCFVKSSFGTKLQALGNSYSMTVHEAYPPLTNHTDTCFNDGRCVTATIDGIDDEQTAVAFVRQGIKSGVTVVYVGLDCNIRDAVRAAAGNSYAYCKGKDSAYAGLTESHFIIYGQ